MRYTVLQVKDGTFLEYGRKTVLLHKSEENKEFEDGIYFAQIAKKITNKDGKKVKIVINSVRYNEPINLEEIYELYIGKNPEIAKKYLFKPSDYRFCEITKNERYIIMHCDEINSEKFSCVYMGLYQRYLEYLVSLI